MSGDGPDPFQIMSARKSSNKHRNEGAVMAPPSRVASGLSLSGTAEIERPPASSAVVRRRMQATAQRDTPAELRIRWLLHACGLRYSVDAKPLPASRRRADVVFRRAKVAVFVDGCFWHGCPSHVTWPRANANFWREKIAANRRRDEDTNRRLKAAGWLVIRAWEHDLPDEAAAAIARAVRRRLASIAASRDAGRPKGKR